MTKRPDAPEGPQFLSEETAHRVLARAVELDARQASDVPLLKLREIAKEAGISERALDEAFRELRSTTSDLVPVKQEAGYKSLFMRGLPLLRNAVSLAVALPLVGTVSRLAQGIGAEWPLQHALAILATIAGAGIAHRLRGHVAAFVLAVVAIAQLAEWPMHLYFGIQTVQGGPTKFALLLAAGLGLGIGVLVRRGKGELPSAAASEEPVVATNVRPDDENPALVRRGLSLRLQWKT